jgi:dienelactone hydrolase
VEGSSGKYPVLLFAPGSGTTPLDYSAIIEDVASHGYVVLGVESPDYGRASIFADGRVVMGHDPVQRATREGARPSTALAIHAWEEAARVFGEDLSFALQHVSALGDVPLSRAADLTRVGVFGHSLGGAAALQCAHDNPRVRAVFDIDGSPIWSADNGSLHKPVIILSAASTNLNYDAVLNGVAAGEHLRLAGTVHSFSSDVRVMPFSPQAVANTQLISPARALRVTATFLEAFFNEYLNGQREPLLHGPSPEFPEITIERGASRVPDARP